MNDAQEMLEAAQEECIRLERENAAALAVIERVRAIVTQRRIEPSLDTDWQLEHILAQSPASALAKVKADALRGVAYLFESGDLAPDDLNTAHNGNGISCSARSVDAAWEHQGPIMDWLRAEADRIEKEAT